jgi:hypothetical protein
MIAKHYRLLPPLPALEHFMAASLGSRADEASGLALDGRTDKVASNRVYLGIDYMLRSEATRPDRTDGTARLPPPWRADVQ